MTSLIHRRVACLASLASLAFLAFNALLTTPVSAQGDVRQPNMEWVESHVDLSVKVAGGSVAVRRTWSRGQWYVNFAWADLKFTRDPLDNTIKLIDRGGSIFERQGGTTAYSAGSTAPAADAVGTSYVFDRQYVIRRTNTGWRWSDRRGNIIDYSVLGRIQSYAERTGTTVRFAYETAAAGLTDKLLAVNDHFGNTALSFSYTGEQLTGITDRAGRSVTYRVSVQPPHRRVAAVQRVSIQVALPVGLA